jgi:hypothetical protein
MSISSQQYANLIQHAYGQEVDGKKGQMQHLVGDEVTLEGVTYKVLEYMDQPSGYQGAIHQCVDTGEIVVTHCRDISPASTKTGNVQCRVAAVFGAAARSDASIKKLEIRRRRLWLGVGVMLSLSACNLSTPFGKKPVVDYKQNPSPQQRYDITLTITDAPGTFASMEGLVQYNVVNEECLPPPNSNPGGYSSRRTLHVPFALTQVSENEYKGAVYADLMLDADYHGRGVCHWQLIQAQVHMKATGVGGETLFAPDLSASLLLAGQKKTLYFLKASYPRHPESILETPLAFGQADRSKMLSTLMDEDLFTITLTSKAGTP